MKRYRVCAYGDEYFVVALAYGSIVCRCENEAHALRIAFLLDEDTDPDNEEPRGAVAAMDKKN